MGDSDRNQYSNSYSVKSGPFYNSSEFYHAIILEDLRGGASVILWYLFTYLYKLFIIADFQEHSSDQTWSGPGCSKLGYDNPGLMQIWIQIWKLKKLNSE